MCSEMAHKIKALAGKPDNLHLICGTPDGRRQLMLACCFLTTAFSLWHVPRPHPP